MKKIFFALAMGLAVAACTTAEYDDSAIKEQINNLDDRLTQVEEDLATLELNVAAMKSLAEALKNGKYIETVTAIEGGYTVTFSDETSVVIMHGEKGDKGDKGETGATGETGAAGKDGVTPTVVVKANANGELCWYINGEEVCPVYEAAPVFTSVDGNLYVTYPGSEPKFVGALTGVSIFKTVDVLENTVKFTFVGENGEAGESFELPLPQPFALNINTSVGLELGATSVEIPFTVTGATEATVVDVLAVGCDVVVNEGVLSVSNITSGAQILVFADNGEGKTSIKKIVFAGESFEVNDVEETIPAAGGSVEVKGVSNIEFNVVIPTEATWLTYAETKSAFSLTFTAEPNTSYEVRSVAVSFVHAATGAVLKTVTIAQEAAEKPFAKRVWGIYGAFADPEIDNRNMAMDDEFVYVANSTGAPAIHKFNIADGKYAGQLDVTGISTGTHPVSVLKVIKNTSADVNGGKDILVSCNLTTDGAALQIWSWENGTDAAPVQKYSLAAARRFGDKMNFSGTWQSGRFWFRSNQAGDALVATIPIDNGAVQTWIDAYRMKLEDYQCMSDVFWYPTDKGTVADYCLIGTNSSTALYLMSGTSAAGAGVVHTKYENLNNTLGVNFFEYNGTKYIAWVNMAKGGQYPKLQVVEGDGSSIDTLKAALDSYPTNVVFEAPLQAADATVAGGSTGVNADCSVRVVNGKVYIAAMGWKNGIAVFELL